MASQTSPAGLIDSRNHPHSTPAFHFSRSASFANGASSSSPPTDGLVTPRDSEKDIGRANGRKGRDSRRSVRVRESSGQDSSPFLMSLAKPPTEYALAEPHLLPAPSLLSNRNPSRARVSPGSHSRTALAYPVDTLALAQAHGITADQFEEAKQQVMRFLRADASAVPGAHPESLDKGKGKSTGLGRSASFLASPSGSVTGEASYGFSTATDSGLSPASMLDSSRPRPSLDDVVERRTPRDLRQWSEYSGDDELHDASFQPTPYSSRAKGPMSAGPSPHYATATSPAYSSQHSRQPLSAPRGMMERFLYERETVAEDFDSSSGSGVSEFQQHARDVFLPATTKDASGNEYIPSQNATIFNAPPLSPISSRATRADLLCSPDVARLLKSELKQLAASGKKHGSPSQDILVEEPFSSPFNSRLAYGDADYGAGYSAKRNRADSEALEAKRTKWDATERLGGSPCPSNVSLRAPSFCDSSPAGSDSASRFVDTMPPASAPEFAYHGPPTSSPSASESSSDYVPGHDEKGSPEPGPSNSRRVHSDLAPPFVESSGGGPKRKRGPPLKRSESSPAIIGADGHHKPAWSYAALIGQAVFSTESSKISLADVYSYIMTSYPYYKKEDSGWQNSIRHNLSLNECFIKTARGADNPGKGCLWAISPGCEEQFADGGFVKKNAGPSRGPTRKSRAAKSASKLDPTSARGKQIAEDSPTSSRGASPAVIPYKPVLVAMPPLVPKKRASRAVPSPQPLRKISPVPQREVSPPAPSPPPFIAEVALPLPYSRPSSVASETFPARIGLDRRHSSVSIASAPSPVAEPVLRSMSSKAEGLAPAYELRTAPIMLPVVPAMALEHSVFAASVPASPPTSVYNRLAEPYQPLGYALSSAQNHRALALLASPEATGIMPVHPSVYDVRPILSTPQDTDAPFPPLNIFPPSGRSRQRTSEFTISESPRQSIMRSPVSSLRGSIGDDKPLSFLDPEKRSYLCSPKRNRSHLPAVAALAFEASTPPRMLRSPTGHSRSRSIGTLGALHGTPGGRARWSDPFGGDGGIEELTDYSSNASLQGGSFWSPSTTGAW